MVEKQVTGRPARTDEEFEELAAELIDMATNTEMIHLSEFSCKHGKVQSWINDLADRNETFFEALQIARFQIGRRWLNQSFTGKISGPFAMHKPGMYLKDVQNYWIDNYREQEKAKAEAHAAKEKGEETDALKRIADMLDRHEKSSQ